jgi:cytochrome c biogenesis protein CcdA/PKD repeat protein
VITLDGSGSSDNVGVTQYVWTFLDKTPQTLTGRMTNYTFTTPSRYVVTLNVSDAAGNWATDNVLITVADTTPPIGDAGGNRTVQEDIVVELDGSGSTDNVAVTNYTWTFLDKAPQTLTGMTQSYRFTTPGVYNVTLHVSDAAGHSTSAVTTITVEDITPPTANAGSDQIVNKDILISFSASNSTDNTHLINYTWNYGEGAYGVGEVSSHRFSEPGNYTVTLTVTDTAGNSGNDRIQVTVLPHTYNDVVTITTRGQERLVFIQSCCKISSFNFSEQDRMLLFTVGETSLKGGFANVTLPIDLLGDSFTMYSDDARIIPGEMRNSTHIVLFFRYSHSTHTFTIASTPAGGINVSGLPLIFTSGALALLSPCGFPLLPGYISYYLGRRSSVERAVSGGVACTLGLVSVFSIIGIGVSLLGSLVTQYILALELIAGILAVLMGISMVLDVKFPLIQISKAPRQKGLSGLFVYGIAYGLATLGCSAPIFFSTLFYAISSGGLIQGILTFMIYALGMGLPILIITLLVAKTKSALINRIMKVMPWFQRISSVILIVTGIYLISYYYVYS